MVSSLDVVIIKLGNRCTDPEQGFGKIKLFSPVEIIWKVLVFFDIGFVPIFWLIIPHKAVECWLNHLLNKRWKYKKMFWTWNTQGVLASKFPISIWTQIQGQHGCQIFRKIVYNYLPISDFATRSLNLGKPQKSQKFCKKIFFFVKKCKL